MTVSVQNDRARMQEHSPQGEAHQYPPTYVNATTAPAADGRDRPSEGSSPSPPPFSSYSPAVQGDKDGAEVIERDVMRTPSPTPSEDRVLSEKTRICDWKRTYQLLRNPRPWLTRRNIGTITIVTLVLVFFIAFLANQSKIVNKLHPVTDFLRDTPGGWLVPIAVMFVISFPPLFGHELIAVLCGDIWGVWIGFGIVAAGTFFGELGNFYAFKWCCRARGEKMEEKRLKYALYAQVVREGGLKMPTIMRFTIIPSHLLTAVFSTCGMSVWMFCVSAFLSLPKQLAIVYIGVAKEASGDAAQAKATGLKVVVILISLAVTVVGMWFINKKMDEVKHRVVYARRKRRQAKALADADLYPSPPGLGPDSSRTHPAAAAYELEPLSPSVAKPRALKGGSGADAPVIVIDTAPRSPTHGGGLDPPGLVMRAHAHAYADSGDMTPYEMEDQSPSPSSSPAKGRFSGAGRSRSESAVISAVPQAALGSGNGRAGWRS